MIEMVILNHVIKANSLPKIFRLIGDILKFFSQNKPGNKFQKVSVGYIRKLVWQI